MIVLLAASGSQRLSISRRAPCAVLFARVAVSNLGCPWFALDNRTRAVMADGDIRSPNDDRAVAREL